MKQLHHQHSFIERKTKYVNKIYINDQIDENDIQYLKNILKDTFCVDIAIKSYKLK